MKKPKRSEADPTMIPASGRGADRLFAQVAGILEEAQRQTVCSVNTHMVAAYWLIGWRIVEAEQGGRERAGYGERLMENLSARLTKRYGRGFSVANLKNFREFYLAYPDRLAEIRYPAGSELVSGPQRGDSSAVPPVIRYPAGSQSGFHPNLGWSHYRALMRIEKPEARRFYEQEAALAGWSKRELERQIGSLYYERLLMSRDKRRMLAETRRRGSLEHPLEVIKDPYVLEFLNLPESHELNETELEARLITHLQEFLLELGYGFAFIGRQQRLTLDGDHFYTDLVFYHVRLKCYIIIDLKTTKLSHADLGQMQLYVNYYDQEVAGTEDNPTLGLVLCTDKNDAVVRYVLGKNREKIFASRYRMELPTEAELAAEVRREMKALGMGEKPEATSFPPSKRKRSTARSGFSHREQP